MTKARFLKSASLEELRNSIRKNLDQYRTGDFSAITADPAYWFEHEIEVDETKLSELRAPSDGKYYEVQNCRVIYEALKNLSPYEARDERFWAYLTHTFLLEHARARWPIPTDDEVAIKHISKHFFGRDKRQIERDNVGSRLWWMAHLCSRVQSMQHEDALEAFLFRSDVRANLVERPTTSQCSELFGSILGKLALSLNGGKHLFERATFRKLMMEINSVGGYKLLDCLPKAQVDEIIDDIIGNRLSLAAL